MFGRYWGEADIARAALPCRSEAIDPKRSFDDLVGERE
jgi:hypothetical protein